MEPESADADHIREAAALSQEKALVPLIEDLSEWLTKALGTPVNPDEFMSSLDDGVILCQLILAIQNKQANKLKVCSMLTVSANQGVIGYTGTETQQNLF